MEKISLNGKWQFKQTDTDVWMDAAVPGCNFLDLMDNGVISDPFIGLVENDVQWVGEKDWEYRKTFTPVKDFESCYKVILNCDMLDTICDIYINGNIVGISKNCFIKFSADIKEYINPGENEIRIVFHSPVKYVREKYRQCPTPINSNGMNGICHIRKPQCHFGWDWGPVLPSSGITGDIYIDFVKYHALQYIKIQQYHKNGKVKLYVHADIIKSPDLKYVCEISLVSPDGTTVTLSGRSVAFDIDDPQMWWTKELSGKDKQPLYTVITVLRLDNGEILDRKVKRVGLKILVLDRSNDEYGQNFRFILNGVPLFIKGANYIPPDCFITRFDNKKLNRLLDAVQFSNINMIRIWGGGYYGSDEFYDACDERGILVWQDLPFACTAYPFFLPDFLDNVQKELEYNIKRINHHPSLAIWCGNNEIEDMHMSWAHMRKYVEYTEKFFYHIPEPIIRNENAFVPYIPGSPCGTAHNHGVHSDNVGDTHLWGVWHGLQPMNHYRSRKTRFCSEFGFESLPDMKTIKTFAKPSDFSLSSAVFKAHQKCIGGNDKMVYYIASRFDLPKRFRDYIYLSQITQQECIADATEFWRRNKGVCNGAMYWQLNDCWGVCSWSSIDYNLNYKALQYKARYFNAPLSVSIDDSPESIKIFALNDYGYLKITAVEYEIFDFEKGTIKKETRRVVINRSSKELAFDLDPKEITSKYGKKTTGIAVRLYENRRIIMQKVFLFDKEKKLELPHAKLKCRIFIEKDQLRINVRTDKFARFVKLESSKSTLPFSDNFFDMLPGQNLWVSMKKDPALSLKEQAKSISVYSLCNIEKDKNVISSKIKQYKLFASPANIANAVYHSKPSKDIEI